MRKILSVWTKFFLTTTLSKIAILFALSAGPDLAVVWSAAIKYLDESVFVDDPMSSIYCKLGFTAFLSIVQELNVKVDFFSIDSLNNTWVFGSRMSNGL